MKKIRNIVGALALVMVGMILDQMLQPIVRVNIGSSRDMFYDPVTRTAYITNYVVTGGPSDSNLPPSPIPNSNFTIEDLVYIQHRIDESKLTGVHITLTPNADIEIDAYDHSFWGLGKCQAKAKIVKSFVDEIVKEKNQPAI